MSESRTRKNRLAKGPATILLFSLLSSSCSLVSIPESSWSRGEERPSFSVYLQEKPEAFTVVSQNPISVKRGDRAEFTIQMKQDYRAQALLHNGVELEHFAIEENRHSTTLVIPNVRYPISVEAECTQPEYEILYHPNGATYTNGDDPSEPYSRGYSLRSRLRPNTELGTDKLYRPGYVLTGWNTEPDGSGEHTGLGSRVTIPSEDEPLHLYAEWEKEDDPSLFNYSRLTDGIRINEYIGDKEKVVVPSHINDVPVYDVSMNCFRGNEKTVIFPKSIFYIENGAFTGSQVEEIYFYDNINYISDDSFKDCPNFKTIHINAILAPRYGRRNLYSEINLADKYDILILNKDKKKLLVFGGSGSYISVDTNMIEESLEEETVCINMAVNGWFNGVAQVEMMLHYVKEGDTYLHMPETSSQFGAMYGTSMIPGMSNFNYNRVRFYSTLESNYDLLSLVDFRHVTYLLTGFNLFNNNRKSMEATTYTDFKTSVNLYGTIYENDLAYIDDRGNFTLPHPAGKNVKDAGEADIVVEYVEDEEAHDRLNHYFDEFRSRGVNVFFSPAAVNLDTLELRREDPELFQDATNGYLFYGRPDGIPLPDYDDMDEWVEDYMDAIHTYYDVDFLLPLDQVLYRTQDYWEPDYHLGDEISPGYTQDLIDALASKGYAMKEVD